MMVVLRSPRGARERDPCSCAGPAGPTGVRHHVTPVARRVADGKQDRHVAPFRLVERVRRPTATSRPGCQRAAAGTGWSRSQAGSCSPGWHPENRQRGRRLSIRLDLVLLTMTTTHSRRPTRSPAAQAPGPGPVVLDRRAPRTSSTRRRRPRSARSRSCSRSTPSRWSEARQPLTQYVNDRPYAAGSLLTVALGSVFRTAMNGRSDAAPELAGRRFHWSSVFRRCRRGSRKWASCSRRWAGPSRTPIPSTQAGDSRYGDVTLTGTVKVSDAIRHLYVLLPVLDGGKHYWVAADEVDKLLRAGDGWLATTRTRS